MLWVFILIVEVEGRVVEASEVEAEERGRRLRRELEAEARDCEKRVCWWDEDRLGGDSCPIYQSVRYCC